MRQIRPIVLSSVLFFAAATVAQADDLTRDFNGVKLGSVTLSGVPTPVLPDASGQINGVVNSGDNGGSAKAIVNLTSSLVTFESGTAAVGVAAQAYSRSGVDILFTNTGDGTIALSNFTSTIIPAGMGFYVQDRAMAPAAGNPFTGYMQSQTVAFSDFAPMFDPGFVFATAEFDFEVSTPDFLPLYSLSGLVSLSFDEFGNLVVNENLTGVGGTGESLSGFRTALNDHHALAYDWQSTLIDIPLSVTGTLSGFTERPVSYRANVTSWTSAACINGGMNCIVAYAGFGDPIGRGGGDDELSADATFGRFSSTGPSLGSNHPTDNFKIGGLNFGSVTVNVFNPGAVPEPSTWAVMIIGFGMVGSALRGRRRVAYS